MSLSYALLGALIAACASNGASHDVAPSSTATRIDPHRWARQYPIAGKDPAIEAQIAALLAKMSPEEKVGQIIQADISAVTPAEAKRYHLGSVLNGGNSAPQGDARATPAVWLALADAFWEASTDPAGGRTAVPILWGTDAVHGHNNLVGATIFPHNIGLGAARNPELVKAIGAVTAKEVRVTGLDWTFAPTVAVVRDDRWGRTYEGYAEDPEIVALYARAIVDGLQGTWGTDRFLDASHILATAKHFIGDGGTVDGRDQGDNRATEAELQRIHAPGYRAAIRSGVQVVMASFSSYHGRKLHGDKALLTDVLVARMGFDGFVVGDWNAHAQVFGCTATSCPTALEAGIDMFMAPTEWKALFESTLTQVRDGTISLARLDEAVGRIIRVKLRMGLFDAPRPSQRPFAGDVSILADPDHKALARRAVSESLVLLKNNDAVLPISPASTVLVTGEGADSIVMQAGGWTISWQGTGNTNADFPHGQSVVEGLRRAMEPVGGRVMLSADGTYDDKPDVAVVVFGEAPYAEYSGDRPNLDYEPSSALSILRSLKEAGIATVSVFLSGRPMWVNPELNASDAFVAAWLPGDQGAGIADVLVAKPDGSVNADFKGRLAFSWPALAVGTPNRGDDGARPLFAYGYGLSYSAPEQVGRVPERSGLEGNTDSSIEVLVESGDPPPGWRMVLRDAGGDRSVDGPRVSSVRGTLTAESADARVQEDTRRFTWRGPAAVQLTGVPRDYRNAARAGAAISLRYQVAAKAIRRAQVTMLCASRTCAGAVDVANRLRAARNKGWQVLKLNLECFARAGADLSGIVTPLEIEADGDFALQIESVEIVPDRSKATCDTAATQE